MNANTYNRGLDTNNGRSNHVTRSALVLALLLSACAAPQSSQGTQGQGGAATAPQTTINVNIGTGPGSTVTASPTSAPTAAPSAASTAAATQTAEASPKVDANLGTDAIKAAAGVPVLGGSTPAVEKKAAPVAPAPKPVEPTPPEPPK